MPQNAGNYVFKKINKSPRGGEVGVKHVSDPLIGVSTLGEQLYGWRMVLQKLWVS